MNKSDVKKMIHEVISEMWVDIATGGKEKKGPTGRGNEAGSDQSLVDLYKGGSKSGKSSETLPSVGGAMSEIDNEIEGKQMNEKKELLRNIIREAIQEVKDEDYEYQEQEEKMSMKRIQAYAHWGFANAEKRPTEMKAMFERIVKEIDGLVKAHEAGKEVSNVNVQSPSMTATTHINNE